MRIQKRPVFIFLFSFLFILLISLSQAKTYRGVGEYNLFPGDVINLNEGYRVKYFSYQENVQYYVLGGVSATDNLATISLFTKEGNIDYYGDSIPVANLYSKEEGIRTFTSGFHFTIQPLQKGSNKVTLEVSEGALYSCTDTDAYTIGDTALELASGNWGRNYYKEGITTELSEDKEGIHETKRTDTCLNGGLTEYYCSGGLLLTEKKPCTCKEDGSCEEGSLQFIDSVKEWLGKLFGSIN
ncbi:hypothetical protein J4422_03565 [Candidatus Pacearchaeota archaeon]|nr:hypothetical protein [Candidatus Pacearchaeota archaeon]